MIKNAKPMTQILTNKSKEIVTKAYFFKATDAYKNPIMLHLLKEVFYQKLAFDAFEYARNMKFEGARMTHLNVQLSEYQNYYLMDILI